MRILKEDRETLDVKEAVRIVFPKLTETSIDTIASWYAVDYVYNRYDEAEELAKLIEKDVPMTVKDWLDHKESFRKKDIDAMIELIEKGYLDRKKRWYEEC